MIHIPGQLLKEHSSDQSSQSSELTPRIHQRTFFSGAVHRHKPAEEGHTSN